MVSVRFVPMAPELFDLIPLGAATSAQVIASSPEARHVVCAAPNVAFAMLEGGYVLAAGGVVQVWQGRGYAWLLAGKWMRRAHFGPAIRRCRAELLRLQTAGMWRIEAAVQSSQAKHLRFIGHLGFCCEGTMRRFSPEGVDFDLWALLPPTFDERHSLIERVAA